MLKLEKFVDLELAQELKQKGFDELCGFVFIRHYRVRDEILQQYPGLSDCGYMDLTDNHGGSLTEEQVYGMYTEPVQEYSRNSWIKPDEQMTLCSMPSQAEVCDWLRDTHKIHIVVNPVAKDYKAVVIRADRYGSVSDDTRPMPVRNPLYGPVDNRSGRFSSYYKAMSAAIKLALSLI